MLGGVAGAAAIGAVTAAHSYLAPLTGATLHMATMCGLLLATAIVVLRLGRPTLRAAALGAGLLCARVAIGGLPITPIDQSVTTFDANVETGGRVVAILAPLQGAQRFIVERGGARFSVEAPPNPTLHVGDEIALRLQSKRVSPQSRERQRVRGIDAAATTRAVTIVGGGNPLEAMRGRIGDDLERAIPAPAGGLAAAIVVGLRERVDERLADAFTATGLGHVVALSGWNVAIAMAVADRLLRRQSAPRRRPLLICIAIGYGLFAGASASVLRASLMAAAALGGAGSGRPGSGAVSLSHAVLALLLIDPASAYDPGFRLSALATAGLLAKSRDWSDRALHLAERLPQFFRGAWLRISEDVAVALAAQAATIGLVIALFGRIALWSIPLTLAIAPLVAPATGAALAAILAGELAATLPQLAPIAALLAAPATALFTAMCWIAQAGSTLPLSGIEVPREATLLVGLLLAALGAALLLHRSVHSDAESEETNELIRKKLDPESKPQRSGHRAPIAAAALIVCTVLLQGGAAAARDSLRISILDVGQGDAILIENDGVRVLVDGGPDPARLSAELDRLVPSWDRRIDLVIATHPHEDHLAGLPRLADRYRVRLVAGAEERGTGPAIISWQALLAARRLPYRTLTAGDAFDIGAARITVLWPERSTLQRPPSNSGRSLNDRSIVMRLDVPGFSALFTGDVESDVDAQIAAKVLRPVDLLKSPHHGSATSASRILLDATRPRLSVVSAGRGNPYGHPAAATIERLGERGGAVERTDLDGTIIVEVALDGRGGFVASHGDTRVSIPSRGEIRLTENTYGRPRKADALPPASSAVAVSGTAIMGLASSLSCAISPATIPAWQPSRSGSHGVTIFS